ncbi:MAG TPA: hypothetical protein PLP16_11365, partial [Smithellaceae bacterium]|nr:hypothetical protein [Smithellaceae bacterium]
MKRAPAAGRQRARAIQFKRQRWNMQIHGMIRPVVLIGVLAGFLITSGCERQPKNAAPQAGPPEVSVVTMQPERVTITTELSGRTSAYLIAEVRPQVSGIIQKRLFT